MIFGRIWIALISSSEIADLLDDRVVDVRRRPRPVRDRGAVPRRVWARAQVVDYRAGALAAGLWVRMERTLAFLLVA
jgi:hypothetical protein